MPPKKVNKQCTMKLVLVYKTSTIVLSLNFNKPIIRVKTRMFWLSLNNWLKFALFNWFSDTFARLESSVNQCIVCNCNLMFPNLLNLEKYYSNIFKYNWLCYFPTLKNKTYVLVTVGLFKSSVTFSKIEKKLEIGKIIIENKK